MLAGSYSNGFAPRDGVPMYPELWRGCVGAWAPCLGPTGLTLRDWSGFGRHGDFNTITSSAWTASDGRYALLFPNSAGYLQPAMAELSGAYALSWWERPTSSTTIQARVQVPTTSGNAFGVIRINFAGYSTLAFGRWNGASGMRSDTAPTIASQVGIWSHWVLTGSSISSTTPADHKVYVNGVEYSTTTASTFSASASNVVRIGSNVQLNQFANASLDAIMVHGRQLSASEVRILASRRGIAYDLAPRRRGRIFTGGFKAYWAARKAQIIGGGLQ